jgi:hypothetical protein
MREVSNFQKRNLIVTSGAFEFCTAKIAIPKAIKKTSQIKTCMVFLLSNPPLPTGKQAPPFLKGVREDYLFF